MNASFRIVVVSCLSIIPLAPSMLAGQETEAETRSAKLEAVMPRWKRGNRWTVETISRPVQIRKTLKRAPLIAPIQWEFTVSRFEKSLEHECFRIEVRCLASDDGHPLTVVWVDRKSMTIRKIVTELPTPDGYREMTISYDFEAGQPAPVLGPMTALPIDLPCFTVAGTKGIESYRYTSRIGPAESKDLTALGFGHEAKQRLRDVDQSAVKKLLAGGFEKSLEVEPFAKSLIERPATELTIRSEGREIVQLWQEGRPWPIYCDNGHVVSRLVSVSEADDSPEKEHRP